jgi:ribosomal protein S18 acetylase RimI-like enzyme
MGEANRDDIEGLVALAAAHGQDPAFMRRAFEADLRRGNRLLLLASADGEMAGYGRCARFEPGPDASPDVAPEGYYLGGLLVASRWRRCGIASALTRARMAWAFEYAPEVWYFTNARNTGSLALHAKLGFVEVTRSFSYPNVSFDGGLGVLGRALRAGAAGAGPGQLPVLLHPRQAADHHSEPAITQRDGRDREHHEHHRGEDRDRRHVGVQHGRHDSAGDQADHEP